MAEHVKQREWSDGRRFAAGNDGDRWDRWWSTVDDGDQNWITTAQAAAIDCERQWATPIVNRGPQRWTASDNSGQRLTAADGA